MGANFGNNAVLWRLEYFTAISSFFGGMHCKFAVLNLRRKACGAIGKFCWYKKLAIASRRDVNMVSTVGVLHDYGIGSISG